MATTLKDVANLAKVSLTTASHALNGKPVKEATRERVLKAADKLNYYSSKIGRNLTQNRSYTIGMIILNSRKHKDMTTKISYYYAMITGALNIIEKNGYSFDFSVKYWEDALKEGYIEKKAFSHSVDGIIFVPQFVYNYHFLPALDHEKFPYLIINPSSTVNKANTLIIDNLDGGYQAAKHLADYGHRDIVFINGPANHYDAQIREKGFTMYLLEHGIRLKRSDVIYSDFTNEGGYNAMSQLLQKGKIPTAVFCGNDYMAAGVMAAIYDRGLRIPQDISVVGFDNNDLAEAVYPKLTTVISPAKEAGKKAAERILALIQEKENSSSLDQIVLPTSLNVRDSTFKIKEREV